MTGIRKKERADIIAQTAESNKAENPEFARMQISSVRAAGAFAAK